jgi:deaminated glutathione amidase
MASIAAAEPVKVAALQMTSAADVALNLAVAARLLSEARAAGARVAVLPENFSFMGVRDVDKRAIAEPDGDGPVQSFLSQQARELGLWIVGGTTPIAQQPGGRVAAACLVYGDDGRRAARYDKMHLFDVDIPGKAESYRESNNTAPGAHAVLVPTPAGLLGLSVCYDMRFPELYRQLSAAGAQWFSIPSAFTVPTGRAHWETLLRARAIENLGFVVAAAQWGRHASGRETYGDSLVVDYWGNVLARLEGGVGVVIAQLDLAAQAETRRNFPALTHRLL